MSGLRHPPCGHARPSGTPFFCTLPQGHDGFHSAIDRSVEPVKVCAVWGDCNFEPRSKPAAKQQTKERNNTMKGPRAPRQTVTHAEFAKLVLSLIQSKDEVARLIAKGATIKAIAERYKVAPFTMSSALRSADIQSPSHGGFKLRKDQADQLKTVTKVLARLCDKLQEPYQELQGYLTDDSKDA